MMPTQDNPARRPAGPSPLSPDQAAPVVLLEQTANPSTDFFLQPWSRHPDTRRFQWGQGEPPGAKDLSGADVLVCRYLPGWLVKRLNAAQVGSITLFMDDDLFDPRAHSGLPWRYRWKLWRYAARHEGFYRRAGASLWVSAPALAQKYADWHPQVLPPQSPYTAAAWPRQSEPVSAASTDVTLFYHGSASHREELRWLLPIMARVLEQRPKARFEVIADPHMARHCRALPRTQVVAPMSWPSYQAFVQARPRHIGLAPLLPGPFNATRAPTKYFDIQQTGATGLYAQGAGVYDDWITPGRQGQLLPMDPAVWEKALLSLIPH